MPASARGPQGMAVAPILTLCAALLVLTGAIGSARADWPTDPTTNVYTLMLPQTPVAGFVPDSAGGMLFALQLRPGMHDYTAAQRVDRWGQPRWSVDSGLSLGIAVFSYIPIVNYPGQGPMLASDGGGGAYLAWIDFDDLSTGNVQAQHLTADGTRTWSPSSNPSGVALTTQGAQFPYYLPTAAPDGRGGVLVAWLDVSAPGYFVQRLGGNGLARWTAGGVPLGAPNAVNWMDVVADGAGGAIVLAAGASGVFAQRVDSTGAVRWSPGWARLSATSVNADAYTDFDPFLRDLKAASDGAGGAVVAWTDPRESGDLYAQRVDSTGALRWGSDGAVVCALPGAQSAPRCAGDGSGGVIVAWQDLRNGTDEDIYAQRIDASGVARWTPNGLPLCVQPHDQVTPTLAGVPSGGAVVAWRDSRADSLGDIYAQYVDGDGSRHWRLDGAPVCTATTGQADPFLVSDGGNGGIVAWFDSRGAIYSQRTPVNASVPVLVSVAEAEASAGRVRVTWLCTGSAQAFTIQRREDAGPWADRGLASPDGTGRIELEDRDVLPGHRYGYRLAAGPAPEAERFGEVAVDVPLAARFALHGARPNPSAGPLVIALSLIGRGPARIELLDLAGRRLLARELSDLGPGEHVLRPWEGASPAPGLYLLRLSEGERSATAKVLLTR